jgi:hypothetical protein
MNCNLYQGLTEAEQIEFIGSLVHLVRTTRTGFIAAVQIVEAARIAGKLDNVKIGGHAVYGENNQVSIVT